MWKYFQFFFPKTIEKVESPINGEIKVIKQFGKLSIKVSGMEQSGPMVEKIWEKGIAQCNNATMKQPTLPAGRCNNVLILGLGSGSAVKVINKDYPQAKILGIEIDPIMVDLGKKYLDLDQNKNLEIKIADAFELVKSLKAEQFDLILVDLYLGKKIPEKVKDERFLKNVKEILLPQGLAVFNHLRGRGREQELKVFFHQLQKIFKNIKAIKPLVNQVFICS